MPLASLATRVVPPAALRASSLLRSGARRAPSGARARASGADGMGKTLEDFPDYRPNVGVILVRPEDGKW